MLGTNEKEIRSYKIQIFAKINSFDLLCDKPPYYFLSLYFIFRKEMI
jgi:hypothetical protein